MLLLDGYPCMPTKNMPFDKLLIFIYSVDDKILVVSAFDTTDVRLRTMNPGKK